MINKSVLLTGGTGFIGKNLIKKLLKQYKNIYCLTRNIEKAKLLLNDSIILINTIDDIHDKLDYIIHAACPTESKILNEKPVEVLTDIFNLTKKTIDLALYNNARYCYLSSMEVYNGINGYVDENITNSFDLSNTRNSYPLGKQMSEFLINSYIKEYGLNACILRLSNIFGPGLSYDDNKFFNFVIRQCVENKNIILKSTGEKIHNSCFIDDAVYYITNILSSNFIGTLNITNENYIMSINEICHTIINILHKDLLVLHDIDKTGVYPKDSFTKISSKKLTTLFPNFIPTSFDLAVKKQYNYLSKFQSFHNLSG